LEGERTAAGRVTTNICALVHSTLEGITLPAEDVVGMLSIPSRVTHGEHEWLTGAGPHAVKLTSVPDDLEEEQGHSDRVARRAGPNVEEETISADSSSGVSHVRSMVSRVEVFSVPARREENVGTNTAIALSSGKRDSVTVTSTRVRVLRITSKVRAEAAETDRAGVDVVRGGCPPGTRHWVTSDHTEALGERANFLVAPNRLDVVDGHTTVGATSELIGHLGNTDE
jgi:hypothetical protein